MRMVGKFGLALVGLVGSLGSLSHAQSLAPATQASSACPIIQYVQSVAVNGDMLIATFSPVFTNASQNTLSYVDFHLSANCGSNLNVTDSNCTTAFDSTPFNQQYALNIHNPIMGGASNQANYVDGVFTYNFNYTTAGLNESSALCYAFTYAFNSGEQCNTGLCGLLNGVSSTLPPGVSSLPTGLAATAGESLQRQYYPASPLDLSLPQSQLGKNITAIQAPNINNTYAEIGVEALLADITALQYALTLENLADAFYTQFQANFTRANFTDAGLPSNTFDLLNLIANHEHTHAATLRALVTDLGAVPVPYCTYNFSAVTNVTTLIAMSRMLENVDVMAYDGSIAALNSNWLRQSAATIATVEARFASYLNQLVGLLPFPSAFDTAYTPQQILFGPVYPIIMSCPYEIQLPFNHSLTGYQYFNVSSPNVTLPNSGALYGSTAGEIGVPVASTATGLAIVNETTVATSTVTGVAPSAACLTKVRNGDIQALQYALTLENLADAFYTQFQANFTRSNFTDAGLPSTAFDMLTLIAEDEHTHAATIRSLVTDLGAEPVPYCTYNFSAVTNVTTLIAMSRMFENVDVMAYDGAISAINDDSLRQAAATIATVEARFASYLNLLEDLNPFPTAFDIALAPLDVLLGPVSPVILHCPYEIQLPTRVTC